MSDDNSVTSECVVVAVDVQADFCSSDTQFCYAWRAAHEPGHADDLALIEPARDQLALLVEQARKMGIPVVWIQSEYRPLQVNLLVHGAQEQTCTLLFFVGVAS